MFGWSNFKMKPIYRISLPEYKVDQRPDFDLLGSKVDRILRENYLGQKVVIRAISSEDHPGKSAEELVQIIQETGFDLYDSARKGDRYENIEGKDIDFFAMDLADDSLIVDLSKPTAPFFIRSQQRIEG